MQSEGYRASGSNFDVEDPYKYTRGFDSHVETEVIPGTLPLAQNAPQKVPYNLYTEKLSGTAFTAPRKDNKQSWLYRILPAAAHHAFAPVVDGLNEDKGTGTKTFHQIPNQIRWDPFALDHAHDFVAGLKMLAGAGDPTMKSGVGIYTYAAGKDMGNEAFYSADGDFLIVPQLGVMNIQTELGLMLVRPNEICVISRGIRFRVERYAGTSDLRGYILEVYNGHYELPDLGPIGSNGLANIRDFEIPTAKYDHPTTQSEWTIKAKFDGRLFEAKQDHTPFDVVGWQGNYYPYKYDLGRFNTMGSISYDHPDPSIFTVLTCPSNTKGTAVADFVIFPPRWLVQEQTFRPPWYHRNCMSEFMGLIQGNYDAKKAGPGGFQPAGASLHNIMSAHGPDSVTHEAAVAATLVPAKIGAGSMAFMFESAYMLGITEYGLKVCEKVQAGYMEHSWTGLKDNFDPPSGFE